MTLDLWLLESSPDEEPSRDRAGACSARKDARPTGQGCAMSEDSVGLSANQGDEIREGLPSRVWVGVFAGAVVALLVGLYAPVLLGWLEALWSDPNYSHVYIVPIISGFVIWQRRRVLGALPIQGSWYGVALLLAGLSALIVGDIGAESFLMRSSLLVVIAGLVLFHLGSAILRGLAFPVGFLLFLVPMPAVFFYAMTARLQNIAAESGAWGLDLLGVPVLLDGNVIHFNMKMEGGQMGNMPERQFDAKKAS